MMKLIGSLCVFAAGGGVWYLRRQERRDRRALLAELIAVLTAMGERIRLERMPLPRLLTVLAEGRSAGTAALLRRTAQALAAGEAPDAAWGQALEALPISEPDRGALAALLAALRGDEEAVCQAIVLAKTMLERSLAALDAQRPEEERRATALCFSAAALLVILLI